MIVCNVCDQCWRESKNKILFTSDLCVECISTISKCFCALPYSFWMRLAPSMVQQLARTISPCFECIMHTHLRKQNRRYMSALCHRNNDGALHTQTIMTPKTKRHRYMCASLTYFSSVWVILSPVQIQTQADWVTLSETTTTTTAMTPDLRRPDDDSRRLASARRACWRRRCRPRSPTPRRLDHLQTSRHNYCTYAHV